MKKYLISILCGLFLLPGCDYLNMVPEKDIETIESIFEQRTKVEGWWIGVYADLISLLQSSDKNLAFSASDEYTPSPVLYTSINLLPGFLVANGQQMSQDPYGNIWAKMYQLIRRANVFIDNVDKTYNMTQEDKDWWKADMKALKAYIYFELLRTYGPICLIPQNMPVDLEMEDYQLPRQPVDTCFKEIIRLLDEAEPDIPKHSQRSAIYGFTFTKEAIYALKARVLVYAASPLFNGNIFYADFKNKNGELLFNPTYDREKWRLAAEAADKAAEICAQGDRELPAKGSSKRTTLLNHMDDIEQSTYSMFSNKEYLLEWKGGMTTIYIYLLPRLVGDNNHFEALAFGCLSPSMKMVEMYYTENGLPITADVYWNYGNRYKLGSESALAYENVVPLNTDVVNLHLRREPRFYASIAGDRMYWQRGVNTQSLDNNLLVQARKGEGPWSSQQDVIVSNDYQNICGYWVKKWIYSWISTKNYYQGITNETMAVIRLAEVYLMQAEAWNEYLDAPDEEHVYKPLDKVRVRAGIPTVEDAWTNYSSNPGKIKTKEGMREIIRQEYNVEFAFEGHRYWNVRRWMTAQTEMNEKSYGWNVLGSTAATFYNDENGPIEIGRSFKFVAPRDYFTPFKAEEILISGMKQNPGW